MIFNNRQHAGTLLAYALEKYRNLPNTVVIGLPRGGVVTAFEVAKALNLPLDVTCPRKIGAPFCPELAIGAITETGEGLINQDLVHRFGIPSSYVETQIQIEKAEAARRISLYRKGRTGFTFSGKTVILVDDGLATGATMKAAIKSVRSEGAAKVIVAVPVSPSDTASEIMQLADEFVCLSTPPLFQAVGQFYINFLPTEDAEVIQLLTRSQDS